MHLCASSAALFSCEKPEQSSREKQGRTRLGDGSDCCDRVGDAEPTEIGAEDPGVPTAIAERPAFGTAARLVPRRQVLTVVSAVEITPEAIDADTLGEMIRGIAGRALFTGRVEGHGAAIVI